MWPRNKASWKIVAGIAAMYVPRRESAWNFINFLFCFKERQVFHFHAVFIDRKTILWQCESADDAINSTLSVKTKPRQLNSAFQG